jgi:low affinity Fe/Cu permease
MANHAEKSGKAKRGPFTRFANAASKAAGSPAAFVAAALSIVVWAAVGPFAGFSDVWQLTINTGTTIITFLMVFVIQNSQNRDTAALQIKLDELIRVTEGARNRLLDLEDLPAEQLEKIRASFEALAESARQERQRTMQASKEPPA